MLHDGELLHGGRAIVGGERLLLVGFCEVSRGAVGCSGDVPQKGLASQQRELRPRVTAVARTGVGEAVRSPLAIAERERASGVTVVDEILALQARSFHSTRSCSSRKCSQSERPEDRLSERSRLADPPATLTT